MKSSKVLTVLFSLFAALLLLLTISYLLLPLWAAKLFDVILQDTNVHIEQGEFSRPGLTTLEVSNLVITYRSDTDVFTLQTPNLVIDYSLASLLKGGLLAVSSEHLDVHHEHSQTAESSPPSSLQSFPMLLPAEIFKRVPINIISIKMLAIESPVLSDFGHLDGQISFDQQTFEVSVTSAFEGGLELHVKANRDNKIDLDLTESGQQIATVSSENERQGDLNYLKTLAKINLERASLLAKKMGWFNKEVTLSGDLDAEWQTRLPDNFNEKVLKALVVTAEISSTGKLGYEKEKFESDFSIAATFKGNEQKVVANFGRLDISGVFQVGKDILDAMPTVKAACYKNRDCTQFIIKAEPNTELVMEPRNETLSIQKGGMVVTVGINQAINKNGKAKAGAQGSLARAQLKNLRYQWLDDWQISSQYETSLDVHSLALPEIQTGAINGQATGNLVIGLKGITLHLNSDSLVDVQKLKISDGLIPSLVISNSKNLDLIIDGDKFDFSSAVFDLKAPDFTWDYQLFRMQKGLVTFKKSSIDLKDTDKNDVHADAVFTGLSANKAGMKFSPISVNADINLKGSLVAGAYKTQDQSGIVRLEGQFKHNLDNNRGSMDATLNPITFREDKIYLPKIIENWKYPLDFSAGKITATGKFTWESGKVLNETVINLNNIDGFYDRNIFSNINGIIEVGGSLDDLQIRKQTVTIASINAGVAANNIEFTIQGTLDAVSIENFQAELMGGKVSQQNMIYRQNNPENKMNLQLENIQLSELLKLQPSVTGEGLLNGHLPLRILGNGVEMNMGKIVSDTGGVIRYQTNATLPDAVSNSGVKLALDALDNFRYDVLEINADYAVTGDLLLKVKLEGRNPDLKIKRPFHFNLQVRQNIPALLKSLQLTQEISDSIDMRVKNFYKGRK